jgi:hypothetical protein
MKNPEIILTLDETPCGRLKKIHGLVFFFPYEFTFSFDNLYVGERLYFIVSGRNVATYYQSMKKIVKTV